MFGRGTALGDREATQALREREQQMDNMSILRHGLKTCRDS